MKNAIISLFLLFSICSSLYAQVDTPFFYTNGKIYQTVTYGNKLYVGGSFTSIGYSNPYFAVGNLQGYFKQGRHQLNGIVHCSVSDGAGGWFVGGDFTKAGNYNRNYFAHLDSAGRVTNLDLKLNDKVRSLSVYQGKLYVSGYFTKSDTLNRNYVLRVDIGTALVDAWDVGIKKSMQGGVPFVKHVEALGNRVYLAGAGRVAVNNVSVDQVFAVDTSSGGMIAWNNGQYYYNDFALYKDKVVVFTHTFNGSNTNAFSVLDSVSGAVTATNHKCVFGAIDKVSIHGDDIVFAGNIDAVEGMVVKDVVIYNLQTRLFSSVSFLKDSYKERIYNSDVDGVHFFSARLTDSLLYLSGLMELYDGKTYNTLMAFNRFTGAVHKEYGVTGNVYSIQLTGNQLAVAGSFSSTPNSSIRYLAAVDLNTMKILPVSLPVNNSVYKILPLNGNLYLAGRFDSIGNNRRLYAAAVDTTNWNVLPWNPSPDSVVLDMAYSNSSNKMYLSGCFRNVSTAQRNGLAAVQLSTAAVDSWNPSPVSKPSANRPFVHSLKIIDSVLYVFGRFDSISGVSRLGAASFKVGSAGEQLTAFNIANGYQLGETDKVIIMPYNSVLLLTRSKLYFNELKIDFSNYNLPFFGDERMFFWFTPDSGKLIGSALGDILYEMDYNKSPSIGNHALHYANGYIFSGVTYHEHFMNPASNVVVVDVHTGALHVLRNPYSGSPAYWGSSIMSFAEHNNTVYAAAGGRGEYYIKKVIPVANFVRGKVYVDNNSNFKKDSNEMFLNSQHLISDSKIIEGNGSDSYTLFADSGSASYVRYDTTYVRMYMPLWKIVPDTAIRISFNSYFQNKDSVDFVLQPKAQVSDLKINGNNSGCRVGVSNRIYLSIYNIGTTTQSGLVSLAMDTQARMNMQQVQCFPAADSISGNVLFWRFQHLTWPHTLYYRITYTIDASVSLNKLLHFPVAVTPVIGDTFPLNNHDTISFFTSNSFDPNMKEVTAPLTLGNEVALSTPQLDYTIHFQNTGNDVAFKVEIADTLSEHLDLSTLLVTHSSHNYTYKLQGRVIIFTFDNINLPDSFRDEPGSHGFVSYTVQPKPNLVHGTEVLNTAYIYFDLNTPIITNTTLTRFVTQFTSVKELHVSGIKVYPNPFSGKAVVQTKMILEEPQIMLYDLQGRVISVQYPAGNTNSFEVEAGQLSSGTYMLKLTDKTTGYFAYSRIILNR
ncbi:MAG TPA: T9SS type A sorting domain-containing protein [Bacteroidia bacterium]|nr:T9SS type A sorting domain-containing protein [Bacteroidia bacterium]